MLNTFNKLVQDIRAPGDKVSEEYKAIVFFNTIHEAYKDVKTTIKVWQGYPYN